MPAKVTPEITFANGFDGWAETHHDIVCAIKDQLENEDSIAFQLEAEQGIGGIYELGVELTNQFEAPHTGQWIESGYFGQLELFLKDKI